MSTKQLLDLAAFRGKVVYLDFWASWCAPCRESFPWMDDIRREFGRDGLVVIAVDVDHQRADGERFIRALSPQFRIVFDPEGVLPEKFGVQVMPTTFLIDRNGRIRVQHQGFSLKDRDSLTRQIRSLLAAH
ncbi:MAG: TlpA disulfide reductase family protein [Steroidobacteraceae bacterium]